MAKTRLNLSDIVKSPEFCQTITIIRDSGGSWYQGKYTHNTEVIQTVGVVSATDEREIEFLPQGDRSGETKYIHTTIPIYTTRGGQNEFAADIIEWNGERYKLIKIQRSGDYGYWKGIMSKINTNDVGEEK